MDKTVSTQSRDTSTPACVTMTTAIHNSGSVSVEIEGCEKERVQWATLSSSCQRKKFPLIDIYRLLQAIYGGKCVDVSTLTRWVRRYEQEEVGQDKDGGGPRTEFKNWLNVGKRVLKLKDIMCKSDYARSQNTTNKMLRFTIYICKTLYIFQAGFSVHHQELKTPHTASGICQTVSATCC